MSNDPQLVQKLFLEIVELPREQRATAVLQKCGDDVALKRRLDELLAAHDQPDSMLDQPVKPLAQTLDSESHPDPESDPDQTLDSSGAGSDAATADYHRSVEPGLEIAGRYTLLQKIGEGGMGEVWVARQTQPVKRKVALKLIKKGMDSEAVLARFEQERQALAMMDHPNIAHVMDGGMTPSGQPFFVMELVNGLPVTRFCDDAKLSPRERLELFVPICHAVQHAHQKGIVHRDLKPANILITVIDGKPVPKVIDFGVAKATGGKLTENTLATQFGAVIGTLEYMSPEQAGFSGVDIDTRSDIYSLGVILYELLTGLRPIDSVRLRKAAFTEMVRIIREEEPSKPSTRLSTDESLPTMAALRHTEPRKLMALLRGELDWIVLKCLEKTRDRRYETANGLAREIQRYLADEPVEARPPSTRYRLGKFLRRNKGPVIAAMLLAFALLAGITGTTIGLFEARRQRELARSEAAQKEIARKRAVDAESETRKSLLEVTAAKKRADEEAAIAKAINEFTQNDILGQANSSFQADASFAADPDLKVRTALDRAAKKIGGAFPEQPLVEASIRQTIGNAYFGVGAWSQSIEQLQAGYDLAVEALGSDEIASLAILNDLALALAANGDIETAIGFLEECRDGFTRTYGEGHPETIATLNNLGSTYRSGKHAAQAVGLLEDVLARCENTFGGEDPRTLAALNNLALSHKESGNLEKAIELLQSVVASAEKTLGDEHPDTLASLYHLGDALEMSGKIEESNVAFELSGFGRLKVLGHDHPYTLKTLNNLATGYWRTKQLDKSVPIFEDLLKWHEEKYGRDHIGTASVIANLAVNYQAIGRIDEGIELMVEAYHASGKYPHLRWTGLSLLNSYQANGRKAEMIGLATELIVIFRNAPPPMQLALANILAQSGLTLLADKSWTEAETILRACLKIRRSHDSESWTTFNIESMLGESLMMQEKFDEAELLLLSGQAGLEERKATIPPEGLPRLNESIRRIADFYNATEQPDKAATWRERLPKTDDAPQEPGK